VINSVMAVDGLPDLSEQVSRHGYRIAQEALTNARKHAPGEPVTLTVTGHHGEGISITVRNGIPRNDAPGRLPPSGLGLMGLTERVGLIGGNLTYGVDRRGEYAVRAWLPWT
jgi:signal transduction histidine kinase